jgi:hypothetical protein
MKFEYFLKEHLIFTSNRFQQLVIEDMARKASVEGWSETKLEDFIHLVSRHKDVLMTLAYNKQDVIGPLPSLREYIILLNYSYLLTDFTLVDWLASPFQWVKAYVSLSRRCHFIKSYGDFLVAMLGGFEFTSLCREEFCQWMELVRDHPKFNQDSVHSFRLA